MKARLHFLLLMVFASLLPFKTMADFSAPRILFISNSYTSVNNLPQIFHDIAACAGHPPAAIESVTPGGATLHKHLNSQGTLKQIDEGNWDIVVLQAQSQEAAFS